MTPIRDGSDGVPHDQPHEAGQLLSLVYEELRRLAASKMANESGTQTLQPTHWEEALRQMETANDKNFPA